MSHHKHSDDEQRREREHDDQSTDQLNTTAEGWRGLAGTEAEESADEVARGAERGAEQPDYGREGS